ncbi:hypothetical protein B9Z55_015383 [Caenorhabditis nigoni]|uniref:Uncharacterized protein n=1 Tax=Caenorhabditis nigoni TaxID=1611254 RepID=A0A2G5UAP8_9PELO|nr:hypothetical protein B9Z55_015383 [Caenorhabditis nigoni]
MLEAVIDKFRSAVPIEIFSGLNSNRKILKQQKSFFRLRDVSKDDVSKVRRFASATFRKCDVSHETNSKNLYLSV